MSIKDEHPKERHQAYITKEQQHVLPVSEPSYMVEFREISSHYQMDDKVHSEDISSNGEFNKAEKMEVFQDDDKKVLRI